MCTSNQTTEPKLVILVSFSQEKLPHTLQWRIQGGGGPNRPRPPLFLLFSGAASKNLDSRPPPPLFTDPGSASALISRTLSHRCSTTFKQTVKLRGSHSLGTMHCPPPSIVKAKRGAAPAQSRFSGFPLDKKTGHTMLIDSW